ncbi:hypothetical protein ACTFIU_006410 [Dictyostelium citrinum]
MINSKKDSPKIYSHQNPIRYYKDPNLYFQDQIKQKQWNSKLFNFTSIQFFVDHLVKYLPIGIKTKLIQSKFSANRPTKDHTQVVPTQVLFLYLKARIGIHLDAKTEDDAEVVEIVLAIKISKVVEIVLAKKIAKIIVTIAIANNRNIYGIDRGETTDDVAVYICNLKVYLPFNWVTKSFTKNKITIESIIILILTSSLGYQ